MKLTALHWELAKNAVAHRRVREADVDVIADLWAFWRLALALACAGAAAYATSYIERSEGGK